MVFKPRYIYKNGNHSVEIFNDGTKIRRTFDKNADHFTFDFAENADIKITDFCAEGCPFCHEGSSLRGKPADLRSMEPLFRTLHGGTELAIGGGNALSHPDLEWFLNVLKEQKVLANITINQASLIRSEVDRLKNWQEKDLIHGIGISLTQPETFNAELADELGENVVIHVIVGIMDYKYFPILKNRKVLILGYKNLRRGHDYLNIPWMSGSGTMSNKIRKNQKLLIRKLPWLKENTKLMSFDCLGLEQVDPKRVLNISDGDFDLFFQGSDTDVLDKDGNITCATFYINAVDKTCARMSTAALNQRFKFENNDKIDDLFKKSIQGW